MTRLLSVQTASSAYNVLVGQGLLRTLGQILQEHGIQADRVSIITDTNVQQCGYAATVLQSLEACGWTARIHVISPGDISKTLQTAETLYHELLQSGLRRNDCVIALGGGVVGDVAGFVAATYQRGIRYVQVPTTLLAHDSSIGGKVGVNLAEAKNLVGAFHQPAAVVFDVEALESLPDREWKAGMAEVIKHGIIGDKGLFDELYARPVPAYTNPADAERMIARAAAVKVQIVGEDERDQHARMKLNLGHTIGHAVEKVSDYRLNHGEAISIGIRLESEIAVQRGWLSTQARDQINSTLVAHGLPVATPNLNLEDVLRVLGLDKKHEQSHWTFALPFAIGDVRLVHDLQADDVRTAW